MSSSDEGPAAWLRETIKADLALARRIAARWIAPADHPTRAGEAIWPASSVAALMVFKGDDPDVNAGLDLIRLCGPAYVIDRCEAELAILDEHGDVHSCPGALPGGARPWDYPYSGCRTVRLLASGYRTRPGYRQEWKR